MKIKIRIFIICCLIFSTQTVGNTKEDKEMIQLSTSFELNLPINDKIGKLDWKIGDSFDAVVSIKKHNVMGFFSVARIDRQDKYITLKANLSDGGKVYGLDNGNLTVHFLHIDAIPDELQASKIHLSKIPKPKFINLD